MTPYIKEEIERLWKVCKAKAKTHPELKKLSRDKLREAFDETIKIKMAKAVIDSTYFDEPLDQVFNNPAYEKAVSEATTAS